MKQIVTCLCGEIVPTENIDKYNRCNEFGEDYGEVDAECKKCGAYYETSQWSWFENLEEAIDLLKEYIKQKL